MEDNGEWESKLSFSFPAFEWFALEITQEMDRNGIFFSPSMIKFIWGESVSG
jgi:hypothetical protein